MKKELYNLLRSLKLEKLHNRISLLYITVGAFTLIINSIVGITRLNYSPKQLLLSPSVYPIIIFIVIFILGYNKDLVLIKSFHILPLLLYTTLALIEAYNSFYGLSMFILSILLLVKYGFFNKALTFKSFIFVTYLIAIIEISLRTQPDGTLLRSVSLLIFLLFFSCFLYIILRDDINKIIKNEKKLKNRISFLLEKQKSVDIEIGKLHDEKRYYEEQIKKFYSNMLNLDDYHLTEREYELLKELCLNNPTNKELAYIFKISENSVKQFLSRIYTKIGTRRRVELIDMCKPFFLSKTEEEKRID